MGRFEEALPLYDRSLKIREKTYGPDHPDVAQSLNNRALLLSSMGRFEEAVEPQDGRYDELIHRRGIQIGRCVEVVERVDHSCSIFREIEAAERTANAGDVGDPSRRDVDAMEIAVRAARLVE